VSDLANVQQTSSKCIQNTRANARRLLDVIITLDVCWPFAGSLLKVCWTFAGSRKHPISLRLCGIYFSVFICFYEVIFKRIRNCIII